MPRDPNPSLLRIILTTLAAIVGVAAVTRKAGDKLPPATDLPSADSPENANRRIKLPQEATPPIPAGWGRPQPERLAHPTYWPVVLALGIAFMLWGLVITWFISAVGLLLFALALAGWIGELRHE